VTRAIAKPSYPFAPTVWMAVALTRVSATSSSSRSWLMGAILTPNEGASHSRRSGAHEPWLPGRTGRSLGSMVVPPRLVAALATAAVLAWSCAATAGVIPPGREAVVQELVAAAVRASGAPAPKAIAIDHDVIRVRLEGDGDIIVRELVVHEPGTASGATGLAEGVSLACTPACTEAQQESSRRLAHALSAERDRFAPRLWEAPAMPDQTAERHAAVPRRAYLTWLVLAYVVAWGIAFAVRAARGLDRTRAVRELAPAAALVLASVVASLALTERMPVHDHNSFVARSDCAFSGVCDQDPRGAWSPPTFHAYALLLRLLPYRVENLALLGTALHALSLALLFLFTRALFGRFAGRAPGHRIALSTLALAALHPIAVRLAASDTFWPYALACLWGAGLAALEAAESGRAWDALAAALLLALAMCSNKVFLALGPLLILAPLCWRAQPTRRVGAGLLLAVGAAAAFVAPSFVSSLRDALFGGPGALRSSPWQMLANVVRENLYLDPRLTPIPVALLLALGLAACVVRHRRAAAPVLYAYLATDLFLANQVPLFTGYPTRFIHGFASLQLLAVFAAVGAESLCAAAGERRRAVASAAIAAVIAALLPMATESIAFLRGRRASAAELRALSRSFERLPPHDVLVVPPVIQPRLACAGDSSDPVEAFFPEGEYAYVLAMRGLPRTTIRRFDELVARPDRDAGQRVLFYLGSTYRTFLQCEIRAGSVPDSLERPTLDQVRSLFRLEPVEVFQLPAIDHPAVAMRLGADRLPTVEAGFYWLVRR